jgi:hypothetical protein
MQAWKDFYYQIPDHTYFEFLYDASLPGFGTGTFKTFELLNNASLTGFETGVKH